MSIQTIPDQASHDAAVSRAEQGTPTLIHVFNDATPVCTAFTPKYRELVAQHSASKIEFYQMEYGAKTSAMMKFGPQNMPLVIFMEANRCRILVQPRIDEVEMWIGEFFGKG